jgi:hypothetical protein
MRDEILEGHWTTTCFSPVEARIGLRSCQPPPPIVEDDDGAMNGVDDNEKTTTQPYVRVYTSQVVLSVGMCRDPNGAYGFQQWLQIMCKYEFAN